MRQTALKILSLRNRWLLVSLLSVSLLFTQPAKAQSANTDEFRSIEQPLSLKIGVAAVGAGLVGLELWWFLASRP